jgi:secreted PhoX family phosphatase
MRGEKEERVANEPHVRRVKREKRDRRIEPAPAGMTRRRFLTFLGVGSAALAAGSAGILTGCTGSGKQSAGATEGARETAARVAAGVGGLFFAPIEASDKDAVILPEGFEYNVVRKWGDPVTRDAAYGYNNDYVAYFPIDALEGGQNSEDGLLWVNHEYLNPKWVSEYTDTEAKTKKTPEQIAQEKAVVGGSIFRVRKQGNTWAFVEDDQYNRRIDATTAMELTGPAAGSDEVQQATEVVGTLANCGGGVTPWNTVLTCEENFQDFYGKNSEDSETPGYRWTDDPDNAQPPEHYGWIVEVDPFDPESKPRKHTWLGRIRHENAAIRVSETGKVVVYTGHDEEDESIYKFVSSGTFDPDDRESSFDLLTDGMLYVADFSEGRWVALDYENNPIFEENGFESQADVLVRAPEATALSEKEGGPPIGTPMDNCEDIEVAGDGTVYAALSNNEKHGNFYGQVLRITEFDNDPEAQEFTFEVFATGGPQTGFSSPDNLAFDRDQNLWIITDISTSKLNNGIHETFKNNGAFVMLAGNERDVFQFASGPVESELTGPFFTPDGKTLFLAVQHPGELTKDVNEPTSTWPDGDIPRPAVIAVTGFA